jgi:hypothetical protein
MNAIMENITYRRVGDFNIPNLILPSEEANITLGKWGQLHKDYLLKNKKVLFTTLLTQGKLYQHCAVIEKQTREMFDTIVEQMEEAEGVTEQLKEENQLEWVCCMENIEARANEVHFSVRLVLHGALFYFVISSIKNFLFFR